MKRESGLNNNTVISHRGRTWSIYSVFEDILEFYHIEGWVRTGVANIYLKDAGVSWCASIKGNKLKFDVILEL